MSAPRFSLRLLLGYLILVSVLAAGIAAAYREREEDRDAESYRDLWSSYEDGAVPWSLEQAGDGHGWARYFRRLLESPRGLRCVRRLDEHSPFVAFDEAGETVYYVTRPLRSMQSFGMQELGALRITRITCHEPASTLPAIFTRDSFDPELTVEMARALFSDPRFAAATR